ncbi:transcriptional regulator [Burkholderia pseudomallei]|uniref:Putative transcription regulator protein n=1 Tax=Burkholderia pseudomallei (strain 1710b) TaxID=320372 RepID=Q3JHN1_BURP1|nr:putative transcription regulator protein [Burkholderia pseudomallei 1710b]VUD63424.1 transcriptional regulator [Burkholderia pseudomallei]
MADLGAHGEPCRIAPAVWSSRGETLKQLALDGAASSASRIS